jgi:hypothetical protein
MGAFEERVRRGPLGAAKRSLMLDALIVFGLGRLEHATVQPNYMLLRFCVGHEHLHALVKSGPVLICTFRRRSGGH